MTNRLISLIALIFFTVAFAHADELPSNLDECSSLLASVEKNGNSVTKEQLKTLFKSVDKLCLSSVEYSEWVNEILYTLLITKPNQFLHIYKRQELKIKKNILNEIKNPVHDGIDLKGAHDAVKATKAAQKLKNEFLLAIKHAANNGGIKLD